MPRFRSPNSEHFWSAFRWIWMLKLSRIWQSWTGIQSIGIYISSGEELPSSVKKHRSFREKSKLMNHTSVPSESKENRAAVPAAKPPYSVFSSKGSLHRNRSWLRQEDVTGHNQRQSRTARTASYTLKAGEDIMALLTWGIKSITVCSTAIMNSPEGKIILTVLNPSGLSQRGG